MSGVLVEIRAAEGGDDAKDLVWEQFAIYGRYCKRHELMCAILEERPGLVIFEVEGNKAPVLFERESGGHRFQRVSPAEKRGRVHTSTVTVAVFPMTEMQDQGFSEAELRWEQMQGSGPGGQHRQKTQNCVRLHHVRRDSRSWRHPSDRSGRTSSQHSARSRLG
jgi:peptide chain release factor 1